MKPRPVQFETDQTVRVCNPLFQAFEVLGVIGEHQIEISVGTTHLCLEVGKYGIPRIGGHVAGFHIRLERGPVNGFGEIKVAKRLDDNLGGIGAWEHLQVDLPLLSLVQISGSTGAHGKQKRGRGGGSQRIRARCDGHFSNGLIDPERRAA